MQKDADFVAWACSTACPLVAGLSWEDPQVVLARSAFEAGRAANALLAEESERLRSALLGLLAFDLENDGATCDWRELQAAIKVARGLGLVQPVVMETVLRHNYASDDKSSN